MVRLLSAAGQEIQSSIKIDLVVGCKVTGQVEIRSSDSLKAVLQDDFPNLQLYPIVDHLADKVAATERIDGCELHTVLESERLERGLEPYSKGFVCPDSWAMMLYEKAKTKGKVLETFQEALEVAQALINPAITGDSKGKLWLRDSWT